MTAQSAARPMPICAIFFDPSTGQYGFRSHFAGRKPHFTMAVFESVQNAMNWIDPHRERVWEEASDADEDALLISKRYREGSVGEAMLQRSSKS